MVETGEVRRVGYAPITRIDVPRREIEVTATSEAVDAYGTVFDYHASRAAFAQWLGNVREMHESVAVGRRVAVTCDPERRQIRVRLRISRGAEPTWQKVLDGTLCGASIGAANVQWRELRRGDLPGSHLDGSLDPNEAVRVAVRYDLVELSLVDNPANPDCVGIALVRAATADPAYLDDLDDPDDADDPNDPHDPHDPGLERAGHGADGDPNDPGLERAGHGADGDPNDPGLERPGHGDGLGMGTERAANAELHAALRAVATACGCAGCAAALEGLDGAERNGPGREQTRLLAEVRRAAVTLATLRGEMATTLAALRGEVAASAGAQAALQARLSGRLDRLEAQPMPGGPVLRPAEKSLVGAGGANVAERVAALQAAGAKISDPASQVALAAEILRLQQA